MAGELLDFTISSTLFFADSVSDAKKTLLTESLQAIRAQGHVVVRDFCVLGQRLKELRDGGLWRNVLDANGQRYDADSFYAFCEDVLGFSKTKTQNMISLSSFVRYKDGDKQEVEFIDPEYSKYNTSQLIELSSVPSWERKYYAPSFSVKDMRLVKAFTKYNGGSYTAEEMLERARADAAKKNALKNRIEEESNTPEPTEQLSFSSPNADICANSIKEYLELWPFDADSRRFILDTFFKTTLEMFAIRLKIYVLSGSMKTDVMPCGTVQGDWWIFDEPGKDPKIRFCVQNPALSSTQLWSLDQIVRILRGLILERKYGLPSEYPDAQAQEKAEETPVLEETDEVPEGEELTEETLISTEESAPEDGSEDAPASEESSQPPYKNYNLSARSGRRQFLSDYKTWTKNGDPKEFSFFAEDDYATYIEPIGLVIHACTVYRLTEVTNCVSSLEVLYFVTGKDFNKPTLISKENLEEYLSRRTYKL